VVPEKIAAQITSTVVRDTDGELVQREGERPEDWHFNQVLGWQHTGTLNLNIRYGHMTTALLAQAAIHQFRSRLGEPYQQWDAKHLTSAVFRGLEGDIRVVDDTIVVTYYNPPNADLLRSKHEDLPGKLATENVAPRIPWLYNFKLDFRFQ
jgi:hypothetical protein